jgi:hypothetical protein
VLKFAAQGGIQIEPERLERLRAEVLAAADRRSEARGAVRGEVDRVLAGWRGGK